VEERNEEGLRAKVGGYKSYFLNSKEGRKPLPEAVIRALLPTEKEAPRVAPPKKEAPKPEAAAPKEEKAPAAAAGGGKEAKSTSPKEDAGAAPAVAPKPSAPAAPVAPAAPAELRTDDQQDADESTAHGGPGIQTTLMVTRNSSRVLLWPEIKW
jgi:hypothetical protein